jgi:hypothetical protein
MCVSISNKKGWNYLGYICLDCKASVWKTRTSSDKFKKLPHVTAFIRDSTQSGVSWPTLLAAGPTCDYSRMSKRAFQRVQNLQYERSKDVQRCPKPSSLTIFFQVSCGQAPAKQVAQSKNIYTAHTTCIGSHKRIQQSNRNGFKKTTVNPHGPIVASSINRRGLPLATNESSSWKLSAVKCHTAKG